MAGNDRESEMAISRIIALVLIGVGGILLFFAYQSSQSLADQVTEVVTGRFTDSTIWFIVLGAASAIAGVGCLLIGKSAAP